MLPSATCSTLLLCTLVLLFLASCLRMVDSVIAVVISAIQNCLSVVKAANTDEIVSGSKRCWWWGGRSEGAVSMSARNCSSTLSCSVTVLPSDGL